MQDLLSQQTDKQSIIFLKDVTFVTLKAIVDYMYRGEVSVPQNQLLSFLQTTEALKIRGEFIVIQPSPWCVLNQHFFVGLAHKQKINLPTQPTDLMANTVMTAAEQAQDPSPSQTWIPVVASSSNVREIPQKLHEELPPVQLTVIASTSTREEVQEIPELQQVQLTPLPIITSTETVEEIVEMPNIKEIERTPTSLPTSINIASETLHMETDDYLIGLSLKVEDPDIDISAEQLEGGEDLEVGDDSLWKNEVKLLMSKPDNCLLIVGCFFVRKWRRRRRAGASQKV